MRKIMTLFLSALLGLSSFALPAKADSAFFFSSGRTTGFGLGVNDYDYRHNEYGYHHHHWHDWDYPYAPYYPTQTIIVEPQPNIVYAQPAPAVVYTQPAPSVVYTQPQPITVYREQPSGAPIVVNGPTVAANPASSTFTDSAGRTCREYQSNVIVGGQQRSSYGTACLQADGTWRIVN